MVKNRGESKASDITLKNIVFFNRGNEMWEEAIWGTQADDTVFNTYSEHSDK